MTEGEKKYLIAFVELLIKDAKEVTIDQVLDIIDALQDSFYASDGEAYKAVDFTLETLRHRVMDLKEEQK